MKKIVIVLLFFISSYSNAQENFEVIWNIGNLGFGWNNPSSGDVVLNYSLTL
jgi:hypothetical protein